MEELLGFRYCPETKDYIMELRNDAESPKKEKRGAKEKPLRLKDISRPKVRKTVHRNMLKYHNNVHYENIDIIKKILKKLKVDPRTNEINNIRNEVKKWVAANRDKEENEESKKGILQIETKSINNGAPETPTKSLTVKETTTTEVEQIPPVPPPVPISCKKSEPILIDLTLDDDDIKQEKDGKQQQQAATDEDDDMHDINAVLNAHQPDNHKFLTMNVSDVNHSVNFPQDFCYPQLPTFFNPYCYGLNPYMVHPFYYS